VAGNLSTEPAVEVHAKTLATDSVANLCAAPVTLTSGQHPYTFASGGIMCFRINGTSGTTYTLMWNSYDRGTSISTDASIYVSAYKADFTTQYFSPMWTDSNTTPSAVATPSANEAIYVIVYPYSDYYALGGNSGNTGNFTIGF
jgi:hypothetical protein